MVPDYPNNLMAKPPKPVFDSSHQEQSNCKNMLQTLLKGQWRLKEDVTFKDFLFHRRTDMQMRIKKGWPPLLYHGDLRCGTKFPLPRVTYTNRTEGYYLDIPSQCDTVSDSPCCRDDVGWCGNGKTFCECESCIDYRQYIPAELAVWETDSGCNVRNVDTVEACHELQKHFTSVTFFGDSLVRHLFSSLLILMTADPEKGGLKTETSQVDKEICAGENQFVDSACHKWLSMTWDDVEKNGNYCVGMPEGHRPRIGFIEAYNIKQLHKAKQELKTRLKEKRPLLVIGIGVHENFNYSRVIGEYLKPIIELKKKSNSKPELLWLNTHSSGPLKPNQFREIQGNTRIKIFNNKLSEYCKKNNILVMDTFNFTRGIDSFDGTHYGYKINQLKTQILLNSLTEVSQRPNSLD